MTDRVAIPDSNWVESAGAGMEANTCCTVQTHDGACASHVET